MACCLKGLPLKAEGRRGRTYQLTCNNKSRREEKVRQNNKNKIRCETGNDSKKE